MPLFVKVIDMTAVNKTMTSTHFITAAAHKMSVATTTDNGDITDDDVGTNDDVLTYNDSHNNNFTTDANDADNDKLHGDRADPLTTHSTTKNDGETPQHFIITLTSIKNVG